MTNTQRATTTSSSFDPLDLETYVMQRLSEFFGPDFGPLVFGSGLTTSPFYEQSSIGGEETHRRGRRLVAPWTTTESRKDIETGPEGVPIVRRSSSAHSPHINLDICEVEDSYVVEANLPGIPKDHIEVTVDNNHVLTIKAHPQESAPHACGMAMSSERMKTEQSSEETSTPKSPSGSGLATPGATSEPEKSTNIPLPTPQESPTKKKSLLKQDEKEESFIKQGGKQDNTSSNPQPRRWLLSERPKEELRRNVRLPKDADPKNVKSCLENGVLCLMFSKLPSAQVQHKIEL